MERLGIIDIGSNSIRAVIYEVNESGAYRVIDEAKESARLSERLGSTDKISEEDVQYITAILLRFRRLCEVHRASRLRVAATAAIRNHPERDFIAAELRKRTGLDIEVLSGAEEARLGFLGMINSIDIQDGFLVDIGGGSTEVLLFRNRSVVRSVSFPFGAVNTMRRFGHKGDLTEDAAEQIRAMIAQAAKEEPWIAANSGLPLVGLGGTVRSLCKLDQRRKKYSLPITHHYRMTIEDSSYWADKLLGLTLQRRKRIEGLSKNRADIIVPGALIFHALLRLTGASHAIVSGAGLRDGIFFELLHPEAPQIRNVLEHSVRNLLALHTAIEPEHADHVQRLAMKLYHGLDGEARWGVRSGDYLRTAALLHRIGIAIDFYHYNKHTHYMLANTRINGLDHREILICALIASFKNEKNLKRLFAEHRDLLSDTDYLLITQFGILLRFAAALNRSMSRNVADVTARIVGGQACITVTACGNWDIERREAAELSKEFSKIWGIEFLMEEH